MAKKKKSYHRRKSVGAINPKAPIVMAATVAIGYFMGDTINAQLDKVIPASMLTSTGITKYVPAVAEVGIGAALMKMGKPSLLKSAAGGIMVGAGLKRGLQKAGVVTGGLGGYQSVPALGGYQSVPALGKVPSQLTGTLPDMLSGYNVNGYRPNGSRVMAGMNSGSGITNDAGSGYLN